MKATLRVTQRISTLLIVLAVSAQLSIVVQAAKPGSSKWIIEETTPELKSLASNKQNTSDVVLAGLSDLVNYCDVQIMSEDEAAQLKITINNIDYGVSFRMWTVLGKRVDGDILLNNQNTIDISDYKEGTYILMLTDKDQNKLKSYKIKKLQ